MININKIKRNRIVVIFLLALFANNNLAASTSSMQELEKRISNLEDYKIDMKAFVEARSEVLTNKIDSEIKLALKDVEDSKKTLDLLLYLGLPITIGGFLLGYLGVIFYVKNQITNKISSIIERKREDIIRLVETETFDNKLRNSKQLLVISGNENSSEDMRKFMNKLKFKNVTYRIAGEFNDIPEHDLMIFNTPNGELSQESINELMQDSEDEDNCYVAYSIARLDHNARLNFSNSRFTLYHSILSTLKYFEIAKLIDNSD